MYLKSLELIGFKSFGKKSELEFSTPITGVVGPNGSGKSNTAEAFRFVLGEQSIKSMRGKRGEDLIWGGSGEVPRSNRASVKVVFDNSERLLNVDFDEVTLERVVYRDGTNEYFINGSKVRLKDVTELLAGANIGSSGHHIISQGEADRILAATPRERKQMIEDALGLRIYQYKKDESLKKLEKTEENRRQVESLRRENAPHLKFLERQVKKVEKARQLRIELVDTYHEYLQREEQYLSYEREAIKSEREAPQQRLHELEKYGASIRKILEQAKGEDVERQQLLDLEQRLSQLRNELSGHVRTIGRVEGQISFETRRLEREAQQVQKEEGQPVPYKDAKKFWDELTQVLDHGQDKDGYNLDRLVTAVKEAQKLVRHFVEDHATKQVEYKPDHSELIRLQDERVAIENQSALAQEAILRAEDEVRLLKEKIDEGKDKNRDLERELFSCMSEETKLRSVLSALVTRERVLERAEEEFQREIREAVALIGRQVMGYKEYELPGEVNIDEVEARDVQYERHRKLEKMKIRLEEMGGASAEEIIKEYEEVKERDEFLVRELTDLEASEESLRGLIAELDRELSEKFSTGVAAIDKQFNEFFALMFGGGSAKLTVSAAKKRKSIMDALVDGGDDEVEEEESGETGIDIVVSLPKKRVQALIMLSGGERALASIALIFAMSQVNPPPFIILDETDAALDEANSRRYGDMISLLGKKSQLILITHNRETMSRAGVLYGITMGIDGVSRLLSVKFDEAVSVAK